MENQLYTPAIKSYIKEPNYLDSNPNLSKQQNHHKQIKSMVRNQSQPEFQLDRHKITFENVIKQPQFDKVIKVNHSKLFAYDNKLLFGHNSDAYKPSMFNYVLSDTQSQQKLPVPSQYNEKQQKSEFAGVPPTELWVKEKIDKVKFNEPNYRKQISIFSDIEQTDREKLKRMGTVNKLQLYEKLNQNAYQKEETYEKQITLNSDNYLGSLNCILYCLLKTLPIKRILRKFSMNQIQRNDVSKYEGVVLEQLSEFFNSFDQMKQKTSFTANKVMRLLGKEYNEQFLIELMNPEFKSFYKRDPFEMIITILQGLHDELNRALNRGNLQPVNSYPAFENQGIVEFDYIQAERWDKFYKDRDNSSILDMFQGRMMKHLQCQVCYNPKLIFENFMHISLSLNKYSKAQSLNITELLVDYFQQKVRNMQDISNKEGDELQAQFYCMRCKKNSPYKKELSIWRFPKFLIIQIQRFESFVNKVNAFQHNIFFPVDSLDLRKFSTTSKDESVKKAVYNLYGVVSLAGFINANKFNASVFNQKEQKWYLYEENERVSQIGVESPSKHAYVLFYQRVDSLTQLYN